MLSPLIRKACGFAVLRPATVWLAGLLALAGGALAVTSARAQIPIHGMPPTVALAVVAVQDNGPKDATLALNFAGHTPSYVTARDNSAEPSISFTPSFVAMNPP